MDLTCPKCHGAMRSFERNGVTVDQCTDCRGLFLDRGELDRLIDAENRWHDEPPRARSSAPASSGGSSAPGLGSVVSEVLRQAQTVRSGHSSSSSQYGKKRKKSFLDEIFG